MTFDNLPLLEGSRLIFALPNEEFIRIDLQTNANGEWVIEHLDKTGDFLAGLQIEANK